MRKIKVALVGQPNVGKSTLFNVLTKGNVIVSNWPGTTIDRNEGVVRYKGHKLLIIDLPGIYGLSAVTLEEKLSRNFLALENPDVTVVLVDALNLERTLVLALEVLELTGKVIIAVTKTDVAHSNGIHINYEALSRKIGVPVIPISAIKGQGLDFLLEAIVGLSDGEAEPHRLDYGELEPYVTSIERVLERYMESPVYPTRWLAIKVLEGDEEVEEVLREKLGERFSEVDEIRKEGRRRLGEDLQALIYRRKMQYILDNVIKGAVVKSEIKSKKGIGTLLYNPIVGSLFSVSFLFLLFLGVFTVNTGYPLTILLEKAGYGELSLKIEKITLASLIESAFSYVADLLRTHLGESVASSLIIDGVLGGVATLLTFIPLIAIVMMILGVLEDSGILPRLAVGSHVIFQKVGLSGHSVLPITLSLGCNVPGIMSTRSVPSLGERVKLILLTPFIPCQARFIVLLALASGIGGLAGSVLLPAVYLLSFGVFALLNAVIHLVYDRKRGEDIELLLEIPPLHRPYLRVAWWFTWFHLKHFVAKAGTVILLASVITWGLQHVSPDLTFVEDVSESVIASVSRSLSFLIKPLGISGEGSWVVLYALLVGFLAKELVLSAILTSTGAFSVQSAIASLSLPTPSLISLSLFVALYTPCLATLITIYYESKSVKLSLASVAIMLTTAYLLGVLAFHISNLMI